MNDIISKIGQIALGVIFLPITIYILVSKYLSAFVMNGGKNEEQIIEINREKEQKNRFAIKFPEAQIRTVQNLVLSLGFVFAFGTSIFAFYYDNSEKQVEVLTSMEIEEDFEVEAPQTEQVKPPPPPPPPPPEIEVVDDEEILEDEPEIETTEIEENEEIIVPEIEEEEEEVEQEIFTVVEQMPTYPGCEGLSKEALDVCTKKKIQQFALKVDYPQIAVDNDIEGKVYISFVVDRTGKVVEVTLLRGVDKLLDNAAMKHIKNLPKFTSPGKQRGKAVKVKYNVPISFKLG